MGAKAANVEPAVAWLMAQAEFSHVDLAPYPAGANAIIDRGTGVFVFSLLLLGTAP